MRYMANCGLTTNVREPHFYSLKIIIILLFGILGYFFMYFYSSPQSHANEVCFPLKLCGLDCMALPNRMLVKVMQAEALHGPVQSDLSSAHQ